MKQRVLIAVALTLAVVGAIYVCRVVFGDVAKGIAEWWGGY